MLGDTKFWRAPKLHYWFKSYGNFAEWVGLVALEGSAPAACAAGSFLCLHFSRKALQVITIWYFFLFIFYFSWNITEDSLYKDRNLINLLDGSFIGYNKRIVSWDVVWDEYEALGGLFVSDIAGIIGYKSPKDCFDKVESLAKILSDTHQ